MSCLCISLLKKLRSSWVDKSWWEHSLIKVTLVTCRWLWSTRCQPFLALGAPGAGRARWASSTRGSVCTRCFSCLSDAVPWVTRYNYWWNRTPFIPLLFLYFVNFIIIIILVLVEWVGGWRGCAGSGALPFERGQRACIGWCCLSGRGRGRGFLLLVFWLDQGEPRWVFGFMGATGQAGQWDTQTGMEGSQRGRQQSTAKMEEWKGKHLQYMLWTEKLMIWWR